MLFVFAEREVGYYKSVNAYLVTLLAKGFKTVLHDWVYVAHDDERNGYVLAYSLKLFEKFPDTHSSFERAC